MGMCIRLPPRHRAGLLTVNSHYSYGTKMRSHGFDGVNGPFNRVS